MSENQKNIVIGTAGHVDHGKTALVKALTGIDTDRLKEEKERGMTIEPGFAHLKLPSGKIVSLVDVPGHEKFIRNMLRGISEVDAVLLIVAADDGVMPQTREHLDILRLLGIERGLIVISKIDLVDQEVLDMSIADVTEVVQGTFLEDSPLFPCSSKTGKGIEELKGGIEHLVRATSGKNRDGRFRLPIDRVFTLPGYGTIVTGTIVSGKISRGEEVELCPLGIQTTVRYVQSHNQFIEEASAGDRVGLNLPHIKVDQVERGMVLSEPRSLARSYLLNGEFFYLNSHAKPLQNGAKVKLYSGTSEVVARMVFMEKERLHPGEKAYVQFRLAHPLSLCPYDHYIIRSLSPIATLGGGVLFDVKPPKYRPCHHRDTVQNLELLKQKENRKALELFIKKERYKPLFLVDLSKRLGVSSFEMERICESLREDGLIFIWEGQAVFHKNAYHALRKETLETLQRFHEKNPLLDSAPLDEIRCKIAPSLDPHLFQKVLEGLQQEGRIDSHKGRVGLSGYQKKLDPCQRMIYERLDALCKEYRFRPLPLNVLRKIKETHGEKRVEAIIKVMIREGRLVQLNNYRLIHSESLEEIKRILREWIREKGKVVLGEAIKVLGIGRTQTQPIFDYLDSVRFTMRVGDYRILHPLSERTEGNETPAPSKGEVPRREPDAEGSQVSQDVVKQEP